MISLTTLTLVAMVGIPPLLLASLPLLAQDRLRQAILASNR